MKSHPEIVPAAWGAAAGAVALAVIGFSLGGWTLGSSAEKMAATRAEAATIAALTPLCVAKFEAQADAASKRAELRKATSWDRTSYVEKGGWATLPGSNAPNPEVARACAEQLGKVT
jgi:hypothetical protein